MRDYLFPYYKTLLICSETPISYHIKILLCKIMFKWSIFVSKWSQISRIYFFTGIFTAATTIFSCCAMSNVPCNLFTLFLTLFIPIPCSPDSDLLLFSKLVLLELVLLDIFIMQIIWIKMAI